MHVQYITAAKGLENKENQAHIISIISVSCSLRSQPRGINHSVANAASLLEFCLETITMSHCDTHHVTLNYTLVKFDLRHLSFLSVKVAWRQQRK